MRIWRRCLDETAKKTEPSEKTPSEINRRVTTVSIPARLKRTGKEMRIIVDDGPEPATPDTGLVRLLVRANAIQISFVPSPRVSFRPMQRGSSVSRYLAPDIVSAILSGKHPPELTARRLMDDTRLPLDWNEQRQSLGFALAH